MIAAALALSAAIEGAWNETTPRRPRDVCRSLQRMEARDEEFKRRLRALEGWRAEKAGEERRISTIGAGAGGIVGGVVAVLLRMIGGG